MGHQWARWGPGTAGAYTGAYQIHRRGGRRVAVGRRCLAHMGWRIYPATWRLLPVGQQRPCRAPLASQWAPLGAYWGPNGPHWDGHWGPMGPSGLPLRTQWAPLGRQWAPLGPQWAPLGPQWGPIGAPLGPRWGPDWAAKVSPLGKATNEKLPYIYIYVQIPPPDRSILFKIRC